MSDAFIPPQWIRGNASRQAHVDVPTGLVEEEHGREGFTGAASHLARIHPPTAWVAIDGTLRPVALDPNRRLRSDGLDALPTHLLANAEVAIGWWCRPPGVPEWFLRNADGDVCYFVHAGTGVLETEYGPLPFEPGDFLVVPRGTTHRLVAQSLSRLLTVEALESGFHLPDRGLLGRHALFDPAIIEVPEPEPRDEPGEFAVRILRHGAVTTLVYPFHPFDVLGWKGDLAPFRLHARDFRPVVSPRYHLPPSAHTVLRAPGFVVALFAPRPIESDPTALRVPFFHRNIDYDEVIFYHRGEFFSRAGIEEGMLTLHPAGIHHGPQPQAIARSEARGPGGFADEFAVNVDARHSLTLTPAAQATIVEGYERSWNPSAAPETPSADPQA
jgi:homogentisate 1,2-dioxygenase